MLHKIAQEAEKEGEFKARKIYSIDRVFRNEHLDATHLAEFHQIEGIIILFIYIWVGGYYIFFIILKFIELFTILFLYRYYC